MTPNVRAFSEALMSSVEVVTHGVDATTQLGQHLGALLRGGDVLCLSGDLGAGKTALARGLALGWGALEPVSSPTFVFVHEHRRRADAQRLYHVDCYRLQSEADAATIGLEDMLTGEDVVLLEWPEQVESLLPADRLWISIETLDDNTRRFTAEAVGKRHLALLTDLQTQVK
ncbi:MAG: tRNA (adenosine(37)-N6)-threonylcarbamoyltransferase complex ATPase subunit type 1 TsaE [Anaerolineae bacterium]|nr:tRNA (adenosine(37)-N6)-threonylcarbamoyltransferase complex ATPase subunit type 1 TsaE [Anaerolineae bacterium]